MHLLRRYFGGGQLTSDERRDRRDVASLMGRCSDPDCCHLSICRFRGSGIAGACDGKGVSNVAALSPYRGSVRRRVAQRKGSLRLVKSPSQLSGYTAESIAIARTLLLDALGALRYCS